MTGRVYWNKTSQTLYQCSGPSVNRQVFLFWFSNIFRNAVKDYGMHTRK